MGVVNTAFHEDPLEYTITVEASGTKHASNPVRTVVVIPEDGEECTLAKLRAIKGIGGDSPTLRTCLVASLGGVNVYLDGDDVLVTKRKILL